MKLNKPMWVALTPDGTELVYNWEDPVMHERKRDVEKELKRMAELADSSNIGTVAGRTELQWKQSLVAKVVLVRAKERKARQPRPKPSPSSLCSICAPTRSR